MQLSNESNLKYPNPLTLDRDEEHISEFGL
jgi:hypothetical protein